jgi:hypothetical protein
MSLNPLRNDAVHPPEGAFGVVCTFVWLNQKQRPVATCSGEKPRSVLHHGNLMGIALLNPSYEFKLLRGVLAQPPEGDFGIVYAIPVKSKNKEKIRRRRA